MRSPQPDPLAIERVVHTYLRAKDHNRPHLMRDVFDEDAVLEMVVQTDRIAFPAVSHGLAAITDVLVRQFGQTYENVYTFCLRRPQQGDRAFSCGWLVGMSDKVSGAVRVGCGRYDWSFGNAAPWLAERLVITIAAMEILPAEQGEAISAWLATQPYPWCSGPELVTSAPALDALAPVLDCLQNSSPDVA